MDDLTRYLDKWVEVVMDRPLGSRHPEYGWIYPINYGYIPGTRAGDGEEIDAYVIGEFEPLECMQGYVVAVVRRKNDVEDKLVVCKEQKKYSKEQIEALIAFQEKFFESEIIVIDIKKETV